MIKNPSLRRKENYRPKGGETLKRGNQKYDLHSLETLFGGEKIDRQPAFGKVQQPLTGEITVAERGGELPKTYG